MKGVMERDEDEGNISFLYKCSDLVERCWM